MNVKDRFENLLNQSLSQMTQTIAIAVSGGGDSMALLHLMKEYAKENDLNLLALTVDHGLRPESQKEALWVADQMKKEGIAHEILCWHPLKKIKNIESEARQARYDLLKKECQKRGIKGLVLGHHRDDQIETFLLNLKRGSGIYGLSAMDVKTEIENDFYIVRPLLNLTKADLETYCTENKIEFVHDPMNDDIAFDRVKMRQNRKYLTDLGITDDRLCLAIRNIQSARCAIDFYTSDLIQKMKVKPNIYHRGILKEAPKEIGLRALALLLKEKKGGFYVPRRESLTRIYNDLMTEKSFKRTLNGYMISVKEMNFKVEEEEK